ncbi:MAG: hypothetical protein AABY32_02015 [Nanoarchaeota archaeon]
MSKDINKSRFFYLHEECNKYKIIALELLHKEYINYVSICVEQMLSNRVLTMPRKEKQTFFIRAEKLTSQIEKNARQHAIEIVSSWAKSVYVRKLKRYIMDLYKKYIPFSWY